MSTNPFYHPPGNDLPRSGSSQSTKESTLSGMVVPDSRFPPLFDAGHLLSTVDINSMFDILVEDCKMVPGPWHDTQKLFRKSLLGSRAPIMHSFATTLDDNVVLILARVEGHLRILVMVGTATDLLTSAIAAAEVKLEAFDIAYARRYADDG